MKTNHYFKLATLLLLFVFFGCHKEDVLRLEESEQNLNFKLEAFSIKENTLFETKLNSKLGKSKLSWASKTNADEIKLDESRILAVTDSVGNKTFAVRMYVPETPYNVFYNVIFKENSNHKETEPYVLRYEVDPEYYSTYKSVDRKDAPFKGNIKMYALDNFINVNTMAGKDPSVADPGPCADTDVDSTSDESTGGGDGGWDNGSGGGSTMGNGTGGDNSYSGGFFSSITTFTFNGGSSGRTASVEIGLGVWLPNERKDDDTKKAAITGKDGDCPEDETYIPINEDDQIINELTGKADCVYEKMVDNNNNINWILKNFEDGNKPSEFNLTFQMSHTLDNLTNATTATPIKSGIPNTFVIKINQNRAENTNTSLTIARTIIHEGIHARLWEFAYRNGGTVSQSDFPGVYDYMRVYGKNWDHEQMAAFYRETIAEGLKQFDNGQHSDEYYNALSWEGLSEIKDTNNNYELIYTEAWKKLSLPEQTAILQIITDEKANGSKECI